jgi:hypothetical protein
MAVVAMLGDVSYEGARSISGRYVSLLGASATTVAIVAGFGELAGSALRVWTGKLADRTRAYGRARGFRPRSSLRRTLGTPRSGPAGALAIALRRRGLTGR